MAFIITHSHFGNAAFMSSLVYQTFDRIILGRMNFPGTRCFHGDTPWKNRTHKWYAIGKSLGTAELDQLAKVTMQTATQRFSTLAGYKPV